MNRSPIPADLASVADSATEKQGSFLRSLLAEREMPAKDDKTGAERAAAALALLDSGQLTKGQASRSIEFLLTCPKRSATASTSTASTGGKFKVWPTIPDGRYALPMPADDVNPIHFFTIKTADHGDEWDGFQRTKRHVSDERYPVKGAQRREIMDRIAEDPKAAAVLYGHETNHCCVCGRELTRPESREAGIGPKCAESFSL